MSISAIGSSLNDQQLYSQQTQRRWQPPNLTDTAQLLGISTSALSSDLQSGQTIKSLASSAGVSSSDLLSAVQSDLQANAPSGAPALSSSQLQQFATNLINGTGGRHHHHAHGGPGETPPAMTNTAQLLGISTSALSSDLQSGQTLGSLASSAGVSSSDLLSAVESDLQANAPSGSSAVSGDQLQQFATNLINGTGGRPHFGGPGGPGGAPPAMTNTAQLLGLSTSALSSDLQSGQRLGSLASSAGVSSSDLLSAVESDLQANAPSGSSAVSGDQLQQFATNLINGTGGRPHFGGPGGPGGAPPAMTNTAQLLGLSTSDLSSDLQSGQTLSSLASSAGVSSSDLLSAVQSDLQANAPSGSSALSGNQFEQIATDIINGTGPGPAPASASAARNLDSLASATGLSFSALLAQLGSGADMSQLLSSPGTTGYGSTIGDEINGGVVIDQYA